MRKATLSLFLLTCGFASSSQAQIHPAGNMLAAPPTEEQPVRDVQAERAQILSNFSTDYELAGQPRIALFWNRQFDAQLSQWFQLARRTSTAGVDLSATDNKVTEGGDEASYQRSVTGQGQISASDYVEVRQSQQSRDGFNEADGFAFASGFTSTFLKVPAKLVDRAAIMRLMQRQQDKQGGAEQLLDVQKIETDSLLGFADYLAEVLLTPDQDSDSGWAFMVSVKSVQDGQVVAMFSSAAEVEPEGAPTVIWEATPRGYQKVEEVVEPPTLTDTGEQLAYETMQALSNVW